MNYGHVGLIDHGAYAMKTLLREADANAKSMPRIDDLTKDIGSSRGSPRALSSVAVL